jgi:hypothetical protein
MVFYITYIPKKSPKSPKSPKPIQGSLFIRAHLPTLYHYALRGTGVAELGVAQGWSSIAFARAALESKERYRYRMYDTWRNGKIYGKSMDFGWF